MLIFLPEISNISSSTQVDTVSLLSFKNIFAHCLFPNSITFLSSYASKVTWSMCYWRSSANTWNHCLIFENHDEITFETIPNCSFHYLLMFPLWPTSDQTPTHVLHLSSGRRIVRLMIWTFPRLLFFFSPFFWGEPMLSNAALGCAAIGSGSSSICFSSLSSWVHSSLHSAHLIIVKDVLWLIPCKL